MIARLALVPTLLLGTTLAVAREEPAPRPRGVVLILADDMGSDSVSALHPTSGLATPSLDKLAAQGMCFTDAHSGSGVCSPTRYGLLTGRYAWRTRLKQGIVSQWGPPLIDDDELTLAEVMKAAGYTTACIGKWHLGWDWPRLAGATAKDAVDYSRPVTGGPVEHGFDTYFGDDVPNWPPYTWIENDRVR
ncbi:MAG: arylsulfatase, partial [Planctomycetota bacterium]